MKDVFTLSNTSTNQTATSSSRRSRTSASSSGGQARLQGPVHRRRNVPLRRQLAVRRRQPLGAVRPRLRRVACVRGAVLEGSAHQRFPPPRVARHGRQHAVVQRAVRDVQLQHHRLLARRRPATANLKPRDDGGDRGGYATSRCSIASASSSRRSTRDDEEPDSHRFRRRRRSASRLSGRTPERSTTTRGSGGQPAGHQSPRLQLEHARHVGPHPHATSPSCSCPNSSRTAARARAPATSS